MNKYNNSKLANIFKPTSNFDSIFLLKNKLNLKKTFYYKAYDELIFLWLKINTSNIRILNVLPVIMVISC